MSEENFIVDKNDLYSIFVHGFNTGVNEGPFPKEHGLMDFFGNIFDEEPPIGGGGVKLKLTVYSDMKLEDLKKISAGELKEIKFSGEDMLEFARWFANDEINLGELNSFIESKIADEEREYQNYLKMKEKYEGK